MMKPKEAQTGTHTLEEIERIERDDFEAEEMDG
jgi:hypothetical protein